MSYFKLLIAKTRIISDAFISRFAFQNRLYEGLEFNLIGHQNRNVQTQLLPSLSELFDGIFHAAVPKSRRSREKRSMRRFGYHKIREYATPKTNITVCYNCGNYHEVHTLCGHCYGKLKQETEEYWKKNDTKNERHD